MRISELSRHSGVPVSTIKFYIREGLVPAGALSHRNQAQYETVHLERLDLIRALGEVAGLPLEVVRAVLEQVDKPWGEGDPIGAALEVIYRVPERDRTAAERAEYETLRGEVDRLVRGLEWVPPDFEDRSQHLNVDLLTDAITQMRKYIEPDYPVARLEQVADIMWRLSEVMYESQEDRVPQPGDDLVDPTRAALLGMLLLEPLVMALLRTALAMRSVHISQGLAPPPVR